MPNPWTARAFIAALALCAVCAQGVRANQQVIQTPLPGSVVPKYVDPVPSPARIRSSRAWAEMKEFQQKVLPASMYPSSGPWARGTTVWGFQVNGRQSYPGPTFDQKRFVPTWVNWVNSLTGPFDYAGAGGMEAFVASPPVKRQGAGVLEKYLTVDQTLHWADVNNQMCMFKTYVCPAPGAPGPIDPCCTPYGYPSWPGYPIPLQQLPDQGAPTPVVVHLHGAESPPAFDGFPEAWFTPDGQHGPAYATFAPVPANQALYRFPNSQEASTYWYHDHALGMTRLSMFAGLAGFYFVRDQRDTGEPSNPIGLPAGAQERELALQDRMFDTDGQLLFPDTGVNPTIHPFWLPEFFGDVIVVNGKSWPYLEVEPRRYRLRLLNASNARFYHLWLADDPNPVDPMVGPEPLLAFWQIGTDGGLLDRPVRMDTLLLGVAERADVIVDFSGFQGQTLYLRNDANTPFPGGDPVNADTSQVMQLRVRRGWCGDKTCNPALEPGRAGSCRLRDRPIVRLEGLDERRQLVLNEVEGPTGMPLEVLLNNTKWSGYLESTLTTDPQPVDDSRNFYDFWVTEQPQVGSTEVWEVANLTNDAHPIHLHLIQFQLLNRQGFDVLGYPTAYYDTHPGDGPPIPYKSRNTDEAIGGNVAFSPYLIGSPVPPRPNEEGWKDTILMYPGQVTRIIARWAPQDVPVGNVTPGQNLFPFDPTLTDPTARDFAGNPGGPGYVWHCHILDHEDNEMMRPYEVGWERQVDAPPNGFPAIPVAVH